MSRAALELSTKRLEAHLDKLEKKLDAGLHDLREWRRTLRKKNTKATRRHLHKTRRRKK